MQRLASDDDVVHTRTSGPLASAAGAALFSLALAIAGVAVPLLAVRAGYGVGQVGVFVAVSAIAQMSTRLYMGALMRRLPDKVFVILSGAVLAVSSAAIALSSVWWVFAVSQLLQGVARAFFWTGTQTHAVRVSRSAVGALAKVNLASGVGLIGGPTLAGVLAHRSPQFALGVGAVVAACTVVPASALVRLPPFAPASDGRKRGQIWRRPGVGAGAWAGASAGGWRGLLGSYVPVILDQARQSSATIGFLVSVANAASVAGGALAGWVRGTGLRWSLVLGILAAGIGTALVGPVAGTAVLAGIALAISGAGAGVLQTIGPAVATESVHPQERGEAIASAGTFRAAALFFAPFGVAGLVALMPLAVALTAAGLLMTVPALAVRRLRL
ncbi:MFS transporter [Micromonospora sp. NBC_00389]|uniref:MFS transporter n=1 Tax=Micromonospora sp. NBC_00389 TaxID=2903586 RepID=UPI002E22C37C